MLEATLWIKVTVVSNHMKMKRKDANLSLAVWKGAPLIFGTHLSQICVNFTKEWRRWPNLKLESIIALLVARCQLRLIDLFLKRLFLFRQIKNSSHLPNIAIKLGALRSLDKPKRLSCIVGSVTGDSNSDLLALSVWTSFLMKSFNV